MVARAISGPEQATRRVLDAMVDGVDTTFNGYSITKTLTAATVLRLADQGLVDLDRSGRRSALFFTTQPAPGPARSLGWFAGRLGDAPWYAHAGGGAGYCCELRVYPGLDCASVVMFNRTGIRDEQVLDRLDRYLAAGGR
jgi:hypothetical protein